MSRKPEYQELLDKARKVGDQFVKPSAMEYWDKWVLEAEHGDSNCWAEFEDEYDVVEDFLRNWQYTWSEYQPD